MLKIMRGSAYALLIALAGAGATARAGAPSPLSAIVLPAAIGPGPVVRSFVEVSASRLALVHATLIDGIAGSVSST